MLGLLSLSLIIGVAHQVKKIDVRSTLLTSTGITRVATSVISIAFVLLTAILSVDVAWVEHSLLSRFTRNKFLRLSIFLDGSIPLECLMKVIVYNEAH